MKHSESIVNLSSALVAAQAEMPAAEMDSFNSFTKSRFASLGAIISASQPTCAKHGLCVLQFPVSVASEIGLTTRIIHSSGEWIEETITLPMSGEKGKTAAQEVGSVITYFRRYSMQSALRMYADEDTDGNRLPDQPPAPTRPASTPIPSGGNLVATTRVLIVPTSNQSAPNRAVEPQKVIPALAVDLAQKCKAKFLIKVAEKKWEVFAWWYALDEGWILETERLEDASPDKFPQTADAFSKIMKSLELRLTAATPGGVPQEIAEAYDQAHLDDEFRPTVGDKQQDESWKEVPVPSWSTHYKNGLHTFGALNKNQLWWWCVQWQPKGFKGNPPPLSDMDLRKTLDTVRSLYNFTEPKR